MSKTLLSSLVVIAILTSITSFATIGSATPTINSKSAVYIALGDSVTAGYEPGITEPSQVYGYADRLYEQLLFQGRATMSNYGIIGLKSEGLLRLVTAMLDNQPLTADEIQPNLPDPRAGKIGADAAKARKGLEQATLITVTLGGNDFLEVLKSADGWTNEKLQATVAEIMQDYNANMTETLDMLLELNPDVQIVIADQYLPVPPAVRNLYNRLMTVKDQFRDNLDQLVQTYTDQGYQMTVAHVADEFVGKEFAYTHMIRDIHPNQKGYEIIARKFAETIWGMYRQPKPRQPEVPISVIVGGKELDTPYKPVVIKGRTYVAIKDITEALGARLQWDGKTQTATIMYNGLECKLTIGSNTLLVNKQPVVTEVPAFLHSIGNEQKTYVPLAVIAEGLGFDVQYRGKIQTAFINP